MMNRQKLIKYGIPLLAVLILLGGYWMFKKKTLKTDERFLTFKVEKGNLRRTVSSTGTLQAVITVQVGSQVSGRIQELHADFNSVVKKGEVLAVIDPATFQAQRERALAQLATAEASVKNAEASLVNRQAELVSSRANLEVLQVTVREAERQFKRVEGLTKDGVMSAMDYDNARLNFDQGVARVHQAEAQVNQSAANIRSAQAQLDQSKANVKQAKADLDMAEVNLNYTKIISPIEGVVVERSVDIGQTVAASLQAPTLFLLANDLSKMQVIAQVDEADIGSVSEKATAEFTVDAFPGQNFKGTISEIRLSSKLPVTSTSSSSSSSGSSNVVVYNVMIDVDNPQLKLRPAMTANVTFTVASADDVLKISNAALRFRPSDKTPEDIKQIMTSLAGGDNPSSTAASSDGKTAPRVVEAAGPGKMDRPNAWSGNRGPNNPVPPSQDKRKNYTKAGIGGSPSSGDLAVIGPSLHDQYGIEGGMKVRFANVESPRPRWTLIWVLDPDSKLQPRRVQMGITDGRETAVLKGDLKAGEVVVTGDLADIQQPAAQQVNSPFRGPFSGPGAGTRRGGR
jgi:HlyD family secretion protein